MCRKQLDEGEQTCQDFYFPRRIETALHKASVFLSRLPAQISKDSEIKIYWRSEMTEDQKRSEFVFKTRNNLVFPLN